MNSWGIPTWLEQEVRERDKSCVYCGVALLEKMPSLGSRRTVATWEHIINDARIITRENIARCCASCNSSKGAKLLLTWLQSAYCGRMGITAESVAEVVKRAIAVAQSETPATPAD
jgi:hypothetical protein